MTRSVCISIRCLALYSCRCLALSRHRPHLRKRIFPSTWQRVLYLCCSKLGPTMPLFPLEWAWSAQRCVRQRGPPLEMLAALAVLAGSAASADLKNVLFLIADDLRPQLNKAYGKTFMHTPNLDKFADTSLVFDWAYTNMAICSASRNSFMTGRVPDKTRTVMICLAAKYSRLAFATADSFPVCLPIPPICVHSGISSTVRLRPAAMCSHLALTSSDSLSVCRLTPPGVRKTSARAVQTGRRFHNSSKRTAIPPSATGRLMCVLLLSATAPAPHKLTLSTVLPSQPASRPPRKQRPAVQLGLVPIRHHEQRLQHPSAVQAGQFLP